MENNLFQDAKNAVNNFMNTKGAPNERDKEAAKNAIQSAKVDGTKEEQQQLEQLEQQLKNHRLS